MLKATKIYSTESGGNFEKKHLTTNGCGISTPSDATTPTPNAKDGYVAKHHQQFGHFLGHEDSRPWLVFYGRPFKKVQKKATEIEKYKAQSLHIGSNWPFTNLLFGICVIYM